MEKLLALLSGKRRILLTMSGNAYGFMASVFAQFFITPVLLKYWGTETFGEWIFYYTLPSFASFYGSTILSVGENEAVIAAEAGKTRKARVAIAKTFIASSVFSALGGAVLIGLVFAYNQFSSDGLSTRVCLVTVLSGCAGVIAYTVQPIFRVAHQLGSCLMIFNTQRLIEAAAIAIVASHGYGILPAATAVLAIRLVQIAILAIIAMQLFRRWIPRRNEFTGPELPYRSLGMSSTHSLAGVLANLLRQAAPVAVIRLVMGPTALAEFNIARMVGRIPGFAFLVLNNSMRSELTHLYKNGGDQRFTRFANISLLITAAVGMASLIAAQLFSDTFIAVWLQGTQTVSHALVMLCVTQSISDALMNASLAPYIAVNHHRRMSWLLLGATISAMAIAFLTIQYGGSYGIMSSLILADVYLAITAIHRSKEQGYPLLQRTRPIKGDEAHAF